jgi:hypothetical protein
MENSKRKGAAYEAQFTADAMKLGLDVLAPIGDYLPYDLMVMRKDTPVRVQVKGTAYKQKSKKDTFRVSAATGSSRTSRNRLDPKQVDVLAMYVVPCETWYHIPVAKIAAVAIYVRPLAKDSRGQYEIWKEAWSVYF